MAVYEVVEGNPDAKEYNVLIHPKGDTTVYEVVKSQGEGSSDQLLIDVNSYPDKAIAVTVATSYNRAAGEEDPSPADYLIDNVKEL